MNWQTPNKWYVASDEGYTVSWDYRGKKFAAWPPKPGKGHIHHCLEIKSSLEAAQRVCEQHYNTGSQKQNDNANETQSLF